MMIERTLSVLYLLHFISLHKCLVFGLFIASILPITALNECLQGYIRLYKAITCVVAILLSRLSVQWHCCYSKLAPILRTFFHCLMAPKLFVYLSMLFNTLFYFAFYILHYLQFYFWSLIYGFSPLIYRFLYCLSILSLR